MFSNLQGIAADMDGMLRKSKTPEEVAALSKKLDMNAEEHAFWQTKKSLAVANGTLKLEDGQWIYNAMGETVSVFNDQSAGVKYVVQLALEKLLS